MTEYKRRIFKKSLDVTERQFLRLPVGAEILRIGTQRDLLYLWAEVDPEAPEVPRTIRIMTTGETFDTRPLEYLGHFTISYFEGFVYEQTEGVKNDPSVNDHRARSDLDELAYVYGIRDVA